MMHRFWQGVALVLTVAGVLLVLCWAFVWSPFGHSLQRNEYLFLVLAAFLPMVFIFRRVRKVAPETAPAPDGSAPPEVALHEAPPPLLAVPWYDAVLAVLTFGISIYLAVHAQEIAETGWDYSAPTLGLVVAYVLWVLVLEVLRRTAGLVVTVIAGLFSIYPMFAANIPIGFLSGIQFDSDGAALMHVYGSESIFGLPLQAGATVLVGFILFGITLQRTGGADFFIDISRAIFGSSRGGTAKVAVSSSAAMGMMSGSAVSNVLTTGPMTIPAMKKAGYPALYAGGIEATAASGGSITPPIMGTAAFIMVSFVGVPYSEIALAAAIPALLFYLGIFVQVDGYAARNRMRGEPRDSRPRMGATLLAGWPYVLALVVLTLLLVVRQEETQAPFLTVLVLLVIAALRRTNRLTLARVRDLVLESGRSIADIIGIIAGVGLIVGGLSMSGVSLSLSRELVAAAGDNLYIILVAGAITSLILGMGMTISAVYVFLAIVMVPALVTLGVNEMAAHLFVIYWAAASYITPPVALAAFAAAGIARTAPMATGFMAMRLGMVKYVVPFAFALNPALVAQGSAREVLTALGLAIVGIAVLAAAFEGWMPLIERAMSIPERIVAGAAGILMLSHDGRIAGAAAGAAVLLALWLRIYRDAHTGEGIVPEDQPDPVGRPT
ncbi:TRAP transporter permease [Nocardioides pantholopis]|uniref:TRAP transporter permease n=1 Tax=Nocardioides pantholopis TaxID=2483798 RepID=UPI0019D0E852|nr:TRAP transporter fused permease subunit [Nocardioides pantholopis]